MIEYTVKVFKNGNKEWWLNGKIHRIDGPAYENSNGYKAWYLNGKEVTEAEVLCPKHTIQIDGKVIELSHESYVNLKKVLNNERS